jgi:hypothetical protein
MSNGAAGKGPVNELGRFWNSSPPNGGNSDPDGTNGMTESFSPCFLTEIALLRALFGRSKGCAG